jgi:glycosyltransferase involved in cell wall biosynthesis
MDSLLYGWPKPLGKMEEDSTKELHQTLKLSIVIPTLNQAETIEDTLLSIINQDYKNFEIIVMDGGSHDSTSSIIDRYQSCISHYCKGKDNGQSDAINKGFQLATGDIFAWINSDDYYLPYAFARVVDLFSSCPSVDIVVGNGDIVTKDCKFLKRIDAMLMESENLVRWSKGDWIMQQSCFWTSKVWQQSGGVDEDLKLLMDFDLWFRFAALGKSQVLDETLAVMRYYPEVKTVSLKDLVKEELAYVFARNGQYHEVRKIVQELVSDNKQLVSQLDTINSSTLMRILKRIGIQK